MGNTNADGIWTPDEDDTMESEVWSAAMAESISGGLGKRVAAQEQFVGAFLNIQDPHTLTVGDPGFPQQPLPYIVGQGVNFVSDMELAGGILKCPVPGLYSVTANMMAFCRSGYLELSLFKNWDRHGQSAQDAIPGSEVGQSLVQSAVMRCAKGDMIWASGHQYFGDYNDPPTLNVNYMLFNTISVALVQAFPEV